MNTDTTAQMTPLQTQQAFLGILIIVTVLWALVGSILVLTGVMPIGLGWTLGPIGYIVTFILAYVFIRLAIEHALEASMVAFAKTFSVMSQDIEIHATGDGGDERFRKATTIDLNAVEIKGRA